MHTWAGLGAGLRSSPSKSSAGSPSRSSAGSPSPKSRVDSGVRIPDVSPLLLARDAVAEPFSVFSKVSKSNGSAGAAAAGGGGGGGAGEWAWDGGWDAGCELADKRSLAPYWSQNVPWGGCSRSSRLSRGRESGGGVAVMLRLPRLSQNAPSAANCALCASSFLRFSCAIAACFSAMVMCLPCSARAAGTAIRLEKASLCAAAAGLAGGAGEGEGEGE